jgi:hypothetical protein
VLACGAAVCFFSLRAAFAGFARSAAARTVDEYRRQIAAQRNRLLDHRVLNALVGGALSIELLAGADKAAMPAITAMFVILTFRDAAGYQHPQSAAAAGRTRGSTRPLISKRGAPRCATCSGRQRSCE